MALNRTRTIKEELLPKLRERYARRGRAGKTRLLDALCEDHGYERQQAIKLLGDAVPAPGGRAQPGPARQYERLEPVGRAIFIWLAAEQPCGKRLAPALPLWLPHYQRLHGQRSAKQRELLREVSPAPRDRLLAAAPSPAACSRPSSRSARAPGPGRAPAFWPPTAGPIAGPAWPGTASGA